MVSDRDRDAHNHPNEVQDAYAIWHANIILVINPELSSLVLDVA